jgi:hypothetical protein
MSTDPLGQVLEAAHVKAKEDLRQVRAASLEAVLSGQASWQTLSDAEEGQDHLRRHPRPTGISHDWHGPIRLLSLITTSQIIDGMHLTARPGDLIFTTKERAERLVALDAVRSIDEETP